MSCHILLDLHQARRSMCVSSAVLQAPLYVVPVFPFLNSRVELLSVGLNWNHLHKSIALLVPRQRRASPDSLISCLDMLRECLPNVDLQSASWADEKVSCIGLPLLEEQILWHWILLDL